MINKKKIKEALKKLKYNESPKDAKIKLKKHIGFKKEKDKFENYVYLYSMTKGNFCPNREIICYAGAPGTGKTTFVQTLGEAMDRPIFRVACAGLKEFKNHSILGDENKPSLVAWAIKDKECKNPIILLDELEKVEKDSEVQKDLIKLFDIYKNDGKVKAEKLFDKYYQMYIELDHITFFATVNYPEELALLLKSKVEMRRLEDYTNEEKKEILKLKKKEIEASLQKIYSEKINVISDQIIRELPKYIQEAGIRQTERVLYKIMKEYIVARESGQKLSLENPKKWLKNNVLPYRESFQACTKHYFLFVLWGGIWALSLMVIIKKFILRKRNE